MKRIICLAAFFLLSSSIFAEEIPFKIAPRSPKVAARFEEILKAAAIDEKFKIWIFFTDKGIFDGKSLKTALDKLEFEFTDRSIQRRINRTKSESIFDFYDLPVNSDYIREIESLGMEVIHRSRWLNAVSARADYDAVKEVEALPFVAEIKPVAKGVRRPVPDDIEIPEGGYVPKPYDTIPDSVKAWYGSSYIQLSLINIPVVHQKGYTGKGVLAAFLDSGFDLDHPVFRYTNVIADSSFIDDTLVYPGHGTATLSVCAGRDDSTLIGAAYGADYILAATEIASMEIQTEEDIWAAAAEWADLMGADIISSSVGYSAWYTYEDLDGQTATVTVAAEIAASRGIAVFNSAGNERDGYFYYITPPADGPSVMAIGAVNSLGFITSFSSAGPTYDGRIKPDLVALGSGVLKALAGSVNYGYGSGTSYACPLAAGAAALILEAHPGWTPDDLRDAMLRSADRYTNPDNLYGYGLFDTYKAMDFLTIDSTEPILVAVGDSLDIMITVSGMEDSTNIDISAINLPTTAVFTDYGDRTASLKYQGMIEDIGTRFIRILAEAGTIGVSREFPFTVFETGDSLWILPVEPMRVAVGESLSVFITVSGLEDTSTINITAEGLPESARFTQTGPRTASLIYKGLRSDAGTREILFKAAAESDTTFLGALLTVFGQSGIAVGPNPFSNSLTIFLGTESGDLEKISIHTVSGEKVWDNYTDTYNRDTGTVVWKGVNNSGTRVASGVYLIFVKTDRSVEKFKVFKK